MGEMKRYQLRIGDQWCDAADGNVLESINPLNQQAWALIPQATASDVDAAVQAARHAFETEWRSTNGLQRAALMHELANLLESDTERMAQLETTDNGKVIRETRVQMRFAARNYRYFAGWADKLQGESIPLDRPELVDFTTREPRGVAALITSWNSPIAILANKLAPALAAGCTVVIKPSEMASVTTLAFAELCERAGFPPGVINVVTGDGSVGAALTGHPDVDLISFTGGTATGKAISRAAAEHLTPVTLELGGKSANIVFADADLEQAVTGAVAGIFAAAGQTCIAGSRLLVQRDIYDQVVAQVCERARAIRIGDPRDENTEMGPMATQGQHQRVLDFIERARTQGAKLAAGGRVPQGDVYGRGYFVEPTVFSDVAPDSELAQEEVFGPVLAIIPFDTEEQAIAIANGTAYGLVAGLWTQNLARAHRVARQLQVGGVWVNTYRTNAAQAPFGGVKASGSGRERGMHALDEYLEIKNLMIDLSNEARDPFAIRT
ncbi:aldehyde dehydrogenase [Vreelandella titanicae]|uniref:NAD/NADP-dependent betaine aldehyde dehydrogenase n=1 Tax=Vreelandella titanicae TaxID=664683 RepID=A0AAP9NPL6_9GAMM|nr:MULTISPECIES: aldehyde dehydrogenase [Halomonas]QKS25816.1 NAD/NADP-dependent betaine aldehyde dehydrogenase [Halomonas titanicae]UEQ03789.1 aldehyde dehydrogenase [Halomonas profundus]CDG52985.1 putative aldehyde dehydrogenase DhaS [Halomonas sp. A3H3]SDJ36108.1 aldehyde dehydrogenase (NAD+) [Halomonas titanicae]|tara:strand:+ start:1221 stop:2705 length:1485 start_codon:yes stop_codon:yes gene_type:complete